MTSRRIVRCMCGGLLFLAFALNARAAKPPPPAVTYTQTPLAPSSIPQFVQPLPRLGTATTGIAVADGAAPLTLSMCEFDTTILPPGTFGKLTPAPLTKVWGYAVGDCAGIPPNRTTYLGPAIVAHRGTPTEIRFVNELGRYDEQKGKWTTDVVAWRTSTDQTLHWADPLNAGMNHCAHHTMMGTLPTLDCAKNYEGPIPAVPHLHGGEVPPVLDGGPDAWFTRDGAYHGSTYYTRNAATDPANAAVYRYPNTQEAAPIWFHDHALGATRLNVYAGLAGAYHIEDPDALAPSFPPVGELVPVIVQDRMFDTNGQLLFQAGVSGGVLWALNPEHPYWSPEFVGDTIVVNGKAWPNLDVEQRRYRFLFVNGSNARTYELFLADRATKAVGPNMWVVATDGGYLDYPVLIDAKNARQKLVMMPGERYEVIVDFAGVAPGTKLVLKNVAKTPYPAGATPQGATTGQIMQLTVKAAASADATYDPASGEPIRRALDGVIQRPMVRLVNFLTGTANVQPVRSRQLTLNEVMGMTPWTITTALYTGSSVTSTSSITVTYPGGPLEILLNNTKWDAETTETPDEGSTEVWEIVNLTADAHPIHLHLVQFQILNRQAFDAAKYQAAYGALFPSGVYEPGAGPPGRYDDGATVKPVPGVTTGNQKIRFVGGNPDSTAYLMGPALPPAAQEAGWKDTALAPPGTVTRLMVRWAPTHVPIGASGAELAFAFDPAANGGGYVWHCHIIDHEDNEMMRRTSVTPLVAEEQRAYRLGVDY